ncbi:hypothetical protein D0863_14995 [Hortaea werneckii]|uniref:F-box domain-containing protein n=1 Tax=Hortaea werneckii TaxID=91943 RepID=A0A3M7CE75_HORWE|nr:hypothetical protein D0863_14995 [Hortaea werneckii]
MSTTDPRLLNSAIGADKIMMTATERTFATPELLELILAHLLRDVVAPLPQEDPRSIATHESARKLHGLLRCSEVSRTWQGCMLGSKFLKRSLFLSPDFISQRSWHYGNEQDRDIYNAMAFPPTSPARTPLLNNILQVTFPGYYLRFWRLSPVASGSRHCAYMIIARKDMPKLEERSRTGQGRTISNMLLSQPPCTELEASIWEERDESKDYRDRTTSLCDPFLSCASGLTMGAVHEKVATMFREHPDVVAIKLTTV